MSLSHLIILGIIILVVVPPEKLPEIMRNIGRFMNEIKRQTSGVFSQVTDEFKDIKKDLTPEIRLTPADLRKKSEEKDATATQTEVIKPDSNS